jgi:tRNA/rRNA methyltransferase
MMAGTDSRRSDSAEVAGGDIAPAIILVDPQLAENIGTTARAMLNCGLTDLRLVRPRQDWPHEKAVAAASGADSVLEGAKVFDSTAEAIADLRYVLAATARGRDMNKSVLTPRAAGKKTRAFSCNGEPSGVLFGRERSGLVNDDVALADAVLTVPLNPAYRSLNIAQAVLLFAYEWFQTGSNLKGERLVRHGAKPATKEELLGFFTHLEEELDVGGFLRPPEKRPAMMRNIRNMFQRAELMDHEVRTLRGIISALTTSRDAGNKGRRAKKRKT